MRERGGSYRMDKKQEATTREGRDMKEKKEGKKRRKNKRKKEKNELSVFLKKL
jgi:hypothetical protein